MEKFESYIKSEKCKRIVKRILFYWFIGVLLYFPTITDNLSNPDSIWNGVYFKSAYEGEIGLGRWGIGLMQAIRGGVTNTSFITITGLLYLAIIANIVISIFDVKTLLGRIGVGMLVVCTPHVVSTLTYYYCSDIYLFSYLLAVAAVWLMVKAEKYKKWYAVGAVGCILFSLGMYQSYIGVTILLCAVYLLLMLLNNEEVETVVRKGICMIVSGAAGILAYLGATKLIQAVWHVEAVEQRGFSTMGKIGILDLLRGGVNAYRYFCKYYFSDVLINNDWGNRKEINIIFFVVLFVALGYAFMKIKTGWLGRLMAFGVICLLPVCFMSIVIMAPSVSIENTTGILMLPGMSYIYTLPILLWDRLKIPQKLKKISGYGILAVIVVVLNMIFVLNLSAQTYMQYNMRKTYYVASEMSGEIERLGINTEDYKLCVIGSMEKGNYPEGYGGLRESVLWLTASYRTIWSDDNGRNYCWKTFLEQFIGKKYQICDVETTRKLKEMEEVKQMGNFPEENSIKTIGDTIVVKLSD